MRILSWNCNGAFRSKFASVESFDADIYIVQECEDPSRVSKKSAEYERFSRGCLWVGDNKNRGLGVFVRSGFSLEPVPMGFEWGGLSLKWFLPFIVNGKQKFLGVWCHYGDDRKYRYIGQFWGALQGSKSLLGDFVIAGDFNSNRIWDYKRPECSHSNCISILQAMGVESVYHATRLEDQGKELSHTFFLHRKKEKRYHIDYFFAPAGLLERTTLFALGAYEDWVGLSDHVPLIWEYME